MNKIALNDSKIHTFEPFTRTLEFFEMELGRPVVLAGGCIRDLWIADKSLIKDYDVWVLGVTEPEIPDLDARLTNACHALMAHNAHSMESVCIDYPNRKFHLPKANLRLPWVPDDKVAQLIYTPAKTMQELVDQFDWRVCSFGFDGEVVISDGASDFQDMKLSLNPENALRSPRSTLRRGFRLEEKFRGTPHRLKLSNELILALAAMLNLNGEGEKAHT